MPQWSLSAHNDRSIALSLCCSGSLFLHGSQPEASVWIASCAMLHELKPCLLPSSSCLDLLGDIIVWSGWSIYHICRLEVAKSSFSECWTFHYVLTLLLGKMLDVERYGQYGGKLRLSCKWWYIRSTGTKQNLRFDHQKIGNSYANCAIWHGF